MAQHRLKNDRITICVDEFGAELHSLKCNATNQEYLWHGDATYWGRRSPVLFPIVGSLKNKRFVHEGTTYTMNQHGFARDMMFTVQKQSEHSITLELCSSDTTRTSYPFDFVLLITYTLDESTVHVHWEVENTNDHTMYFSIGGHPAFLCPLSTANSQHEHCFSFDCDQLNVTKINEQGLATKQNVILPLTERCLPMNEHLFDDDALVMEGHQANRVSLCLPNRKPYLSLHFDAPLFGLWSPAKKSAPFVCIEPWYGRCDSEDFDGELKDRAWGNSLDSGKRFHASYAIELHC